MQYLGINRRTSTIIPIIAFFAIAQNGSPSHGSLPILREERAIVVDSTNEHWRLEWHTQPQPACDPNHEDWWMCPCWGFAYGEKGELDLVRHIPGLPDEKLPLTPFFKGNQMSAPLALLPRWPVQDGDFDLKDSANLFEIVKSRPVVSIMNFADYDHDGRATEFVLQIGAGPCSHRQSIMVGISKNNPHLHAFGTIAHPDIPLTFQRSDIWLALLRSKGDTAVVEWPCWDHGSEEEDWIELHASPEGIQAFRLLYSCVEDTLTHKLIKREEL
jgi:hypothetical protein